MILVSLVLFFTLYPKVSAYEKPPTMQESVYRIATSQGVNPELAIAIIHCEGLQYKTKGNNQNYIKGKWWSEDVGYFQINSYHHTQRALKMGLDIHNDRDNLVYGIWLMKQNGTRDWKASKSCWSKLV